MGIKKKLKTKPLSRGRPPTSRPTSESFSRKTSRKLINTHHVLEKKRTLAIKNENHEEAAALLAEISALGGLERYQKASLQGQRNDRGGDSSRVLLEWLRPENGDSLKPSLPKAGKLKMLEVGALSTTNACSTSGIFDMELIDLNSQGAGIKKQDFMERPVPKSDEERFDLISLSLVLNFVPDAASRGQMLLHSLNFLRTRDSYPSCEVDTSSLPCLFIVLPRSCVTNSRFFTEARFEELMSLLGFTKTRVKMTQKLAYFLWKWENPRSSATRKATFPKREVNPGKTRNNFAMTIKPLG